MVIGGAPSCHSDNGKRKDFRSNYFRNKMIIIWLTVEHPKLGRSATNIRCEDMELERFCELGPSRAGNNPA